MTNRVIGADKIQQDPNGDVPSLLLPLERIP